MKRSYHIAYIGANVRESLAGFYANRDGEFGYLACRRVASEAAGLVQEHFGDRAAYEMIAGIGDRMTRGRLFEELPDEEAPAAAFQVFHAGELEAEDKAPHIDLLGDVPVIFRNMTFEEAKAKVDRAAATMRQAERLKWPAWRRKLVDHLPPWWFLAWCVGLVMGGSR